MECLGFKEIVFNKEILKFVFFDKLDEKECIVENVNKIVVELIRFDCLLLWSFDGVLFVCFEN